PSQLPRRSASVDDLVEYQWQVQLATRADGTALALLQPDGHQSIQVEFERERMFIGGAINAHSMKYRIQGSRIVGGGFETTMAASPNEHPAAIDQAISRYLNPPFKQWIEGTGATQRLYLTGADGTRLILQTLDAPYGAKGERLTLELAPTSGDCGHGTPSPHDYCLSLRKMRLVNDVAQPASDWFKLPEYAFDGYRYVPGQHRLLNARHFPSLTQRPESPGVYVIDRDIDFAQRLRDRDSIDVDPAPNDAAPTESASAQTRPTAR
ncbi:MAG: hypothetical protein ACREP7_03250, partial [Lysobacter sp.]